MKMNNRNGLLLCLPLLFCHAAVSATSIFEGNEMPEPSGWGAGVVSKGVLTGQEVPYGNVDGLAVFQGDIVLGSVEEMEFASSPDIARGVVLSKESARWPDGVVPYQYQAGLPGNAMRAMEEAINDYEKYTSIRFVERTEKNALSYPDYIEVIRESRPGWCWTYAGRTGGRQPLALGAWCSKAAAIHEIGHVLGLLHEQTREDRDEYIQILWDNIQDDGVSLYQFYQYNEQYDDIGPYDYASIMHYGEFAFSKNGRPVFKVLKPTAVRPGYVDGLSYGDIYTVEALYGPAHPHGEFAQWADNNSAAKISGDFYGDGMQDIALSGDSGWNTLPVAFSNGNGTYKITNEQIGEFARWSSSSGAVKKVADFNADGYDDIALVGGSGWTTLPVAMSNGDGTFNVTNHHVGIFGRWANSSGVEKLVGDFNHDGLNDIALVGGSGWRSVPVAFSNGDGSFRVTNHMVGSFAAWAGRSGVTRLVGDFDGDNRDDIALVGGSSWETVPVAFSNGDGTFRVTNSPLPVFAAQAVYAVSRLSGDFNGDGMQDIALAGTARESGGLHVALSNGDGTFTMTVPISEESVEAFTKGINYSGDFNGDSLQDILSIKDGIFHIAYSNGDGSFTVHQSSAGRFERWITTGDVKQLQGDFNGDGTDDIVLTGGGSWRTLPIAFFMLDGSVRVTHK
jgi:hypothetical protein